MKPMRVFGLDPGTQVAGWGVLERTATGQLCYLASGTLRLGRAPKAIAARLGELHQEVVQQLSRWTIDLLALEGAFFGLNARSALRLGEARGVVLLAADLADCPLLEISPATVKARVAGSGQASKEQVERLLRMHIDGLPAAFDSADEADALAIALCALLEAGLSNPSSSNPASERAPGRHSKAKLPPGASFQ